MKTSTRFYIPNNENPGTDLWRTAFDHAYLMRESARNVNNIQAQNGQEVYTLKDLIGNYDIPYDGVVLPILSKAKPRFYNNLGGLMFIPNETGVYYKGLESTRTWPRERWSRIYLSQFLVNERFFGVFGVEYLGDSNFGRLRLRVSDDTESYVDIPMPKFSPLLIREVWTDDHPTDPNYISCKLYVNGIYVNKYLSTYRSNPNAYGVGADTNNAHWGCKGFYYKQGIMDETLATQVANEFIAEDNTGFPVPLPYADNLSMDTFGDQVVLTFNYIPYQGVAENLSLRKIKWLYVAAGVTNAYYIPELEGLMTWNLSDYPQFTQKEFGVEVTVTDTLGRSYCIPSKALRNFS